MEEKTKRAQSIVGVSPGRPKTDFYPTPAHVTQALLDHEKFPHFVWECACGNGAMSDVLIKNGYKVYSSDFYNHEYGETGVDFTNLSFRVVSGGRIWQGAIPKEVLPDPAEPFGIVTNPPFSLANKFLQSAMKVGATKFAFLCKLAFLEGQERTALLEKTPLQTVYVFRKRIKLGREGIDYKQGGMIAFAWFVWDLSYTGLPVVKWI